jgi:transcriptional regulator with XRE-family HTH domain
VVADLLTSEQLRAARAILRLEQRALSEASKVSLATIKRLEATRGELIANRPTIAALQNALESAGVVFIAENGGGPGVRLRDPVSTKHK